MLEQTPDLLEAWKLAGLSLQLARQYLEAEAIFQTAVARFPSDAALRFFLARVLYLQHRLPAAEGQAGRTLELQSNHSDALTLFGLIRQANQDDSGALDYYERAIVANRIQGRAETLPLLNAAALLVRAGRSAEALERLDEAARIAPSSDKVRSARTRLQERLGARPRGGRRDTPRLAGPSDEVRFRNDARHAGLDFAVRNSATGDKRQIETMTGGVAVLDYNGDGYMDVYFVNGAEIPSLRKTGERYWNRLFRNNGDGTFSDTTAAARVAGEGYSMGAAAADFDNDGRTDLFVAGVNRNLLFRNRGDGTFEDVTARAHVEGVDPKRGKMWSIGGAWLDFDSDGLLDLFVVNYCKWDLSADPYCGSLQPGYRTYCFPDRYEGLPNQLFRNNGDGTFTDVSAPSGIAAHIGKGMGVAVADYDGDGNPDIFVANDTLPNFLFRNAGQGRFEEVALRAGVAVTENGAAVSSMGVEFRDYDNDGLPDLIVSALEGETFPVFRNLGGGLFSDETYPSGVGAVSFRRSGWSLGLFDFNNDGTRDLFSVNAHVNDNIELYNEQTYRQPNTLLAGKPDGTFVDVSARAGPDFQARAAHRGAAFADFNNDGRVDAVTTSLNEPAELFLNESPQPNHWLLVRLVGKRSNRSGLGARLKVTEASGRVQYNHATTSVGYAGSSDPRVHFGLGGDRRPLRRLEIDWPSGKRQQLRTVAVDRIVTITEP